MKQSRRLKRMNRPAPVTGLSLTALMDVFIVMVIYLIMNQAIGVDIPPPKNIKIPDSVVETTPRQTILMMVSDKEVIVDGELTVTVAEVLQTRGDTIEAVRERMERIKMSTLGLSEESIANSTEVTILADRSVPFKVLKKLMSSSASVGYIKISFAVNKK